MVDNSLIVTARIQGPSGWIDLEDEENGYSLHDDFASSRGTTQRRTNTQGEWVEGTFTVRSVRESVTESVAVWVEGTTPFELAEKVQALTDALDQLAFGMEVTFGDSKETWQITQPADYTEAYDKAYRFATLCLVRATVSRLPTLTRVQV